MPTTTPLTDAIQALTTYANETTGASDTDLSSAVATLVAGYGGGGGGITLEEFANNSKPDGVVDLTGMTINNDYIFANRNSITRVEGSVSNIRGYTFAWCYGITSINVYASNQSSSNTFYSCTGLVTAVYRINVANLGGTALFNGCTALKTADLTVKQLRTNYFYNCRNLDTIVLRNTNLTTLENTAVLTNTAHFKNGGTGGTIYVPKVLYDHLGDNSAYDYKNATNWSTIDGYGTITWAKIEGSIYETQYADGTPIE